MFNTKTAVRKIIGNSKRGNKNDWDGDGVPNKKDCQPRNTMRQDGTIKDGKCKVCKKFALLDKGYCEKCWYIVGPGRSRPIIKKKK